MNIFKRRQSTPSYGYGEGSFDGPQASITAPSSSKKQSKKLSFIFLGSGSVAAKSLGLLAQTFDIEAVVTKPRPAGHHGSVPVLETATDLKLPVHTVENKAQLSELLATKPFQSTLAVLIDFGIIVAQDAINYFPLGIINSHFSLLPQWRGADPITFAILSGQKTTGVSLMLLSEKMDEGPLLAQRTLEITLDMTGPSLTDKLIELSHRMLQEVLPLYVSGKIQPHNQPTTPPASYSRKLTKDDGFINWDDSAQQIEREIRAFIAWPKSATVLNGLGLIITKATVVDTTGQPGHFEAQGKNLLVYTSDKALKIESLKPSGKQEMSAEAFLAGYKQLLT